jgi:hypothetical protein
VLLQANAHDTRESYFSSNSDAVKGTQRNAQRRARRAKMKRGASGQSGVISPEETMRREKRREYDQARHAKMTDDVAATSQAGAASVPPAEKLPAAPAKPTALEDPNWTWDDASQVNFREVKRISVHSIEAKEQVTEARMNGTPIILTGHVGWAGFAFRWLRKINGLDADPGADGASLDLSDDWHLDVKAMANDVGHEEVPVVKRNYNEEAPISGSIAASRFLETSWPSSSDPTNESAGGTTAPSSDSSTLYLHQWQFPLSESAAPKLCNQNQMLPNDIMGEDLLKYWLCRLSDCPLQYIFMGREETMSKLHKDPGGLAISIAPIVGKKECVLVHRDDGQQCLYHLAAPLDPDAIDLDAFPLLPQARMWKTTVSPGEILLMPHGTYHQCRNVTPCLSYSRFHLDTVNLRAFMNSYFDGDAPEMEQDDVLWNCTHSLMEVIDAATDEARENLDVKQGAEDENDCCPVSTEKEKLDSSLTRAVDTLRCLRHAAQEFTRKLEFLTAVKGKGPAKHYSPETSTSKDDSTPKKWRQLVLDCDVSLHEFRYRHSRNAPGYAPRRSTGKKKFAMPEINSCGKRCRNAADADQSSTGRDSDSAPIVALNSEMETAWTRLPLVTSCGEAERKKISAQIDRLTIGAWINVNVQGRKCTANVLDIRKGMWSVYMSYEEYPALYNEYVPFDRLRIPSTGGGMLTGMNPNDVRPGVLVTVLEGEKQCVSGKRNGMRVKTSWRIIYVTDAGTPLC